MDDGNCRPSPDEAFLQAPTSFPAHLQAIMLTVRAMPACAAAASVLSNPGSGTYVTYSGERGDVPYLRGGRFPRL